MWARANLSGLGDSSLAASCVSSPGQYNPARVICSGILFENAQMALTWPGAAITYPGPSVNSVLAAPEFPVSMPMWGMPEGRSGAGSGDGGWSTGVVKGGGGDMFSPHPGANLNPATLVAPLPSITAIDPSATVTDQDGGVMCHLNSMAARTPVMAVVAAAALYWLLKGK